MLRLLLTRFTMTFLIGFLWTSLVSAYEGVEVRNGGSLVGQVKLAGKVPEPKTIPITKDQKVCGTKRLAGDLIVSKSRGIQNAVVSLTMIKSGKKLEVPKATLLKFDQKGCAYHPHVLIIPAGGAVEISNSDPTLHNIHTFGFENNPINFAQPKFTKRSETLEVPETIKVVCDVHKWMKAWWIVAGHPYYAVTDKEGKFKLTGIPPGTYEVRVWHETLRIKTQPVTIKAGQEANVTFEFTAKKR